MVSQSYQQSSTHISCLSFILLPNESHNQFIDEFAAWLPNIITKYNNILIAGNFNSHIDDTDCNEGTIFKDTMESFGLIQHVGTPTHEDGHTLDFIMMEQGSKLQVENCFTGPLLSDHNMVECITTMPRGSIHHKQISFHKLKNINIEELAKELSLDENISDDLNTLIQELDNKSKVALYKVAPLKTKSISKSI